MPSAVVAPHRRTRITFGPDILEVMEGRLASGRFSVRMCSLAFEEPESRLSASEEHDRSLFENLTPLGCVPVLTQD